MCTAYRERAADLYACICRNTHMLAYRPACSRQNGTRRNIVLCSHYFLLELRTTAGCCFVSITVSILKCCKLWGVTLPGPRVLCSAPNRYMCSKGKQAVVLSCPVWLSPAVWEQGALPEYTWPLNPRTARRAPITVPQCIISKQTDLYIKTQTTTYSGQVPLKASALLN